jgi:hypothetical protein
MISTENGKKPATHRKDIHLCCYYPLEVNDGGTTRILMAPVVMAREDDDDDADDVLFLLENSRRMSPGG